MLCNFASDFGNVLKNVNAIFFVDPLALVKPLGGYFSHYEQIWTAIIT